MGGLTLSVVVDVESILWHRHVLQADYAAGDLTVGYTAQDDSSKLSASYKVGDMKVGVSSDSDNGAGVTTNQASVSYTAGNVTLKGAADDQDGWDLDVAYSVGAISVAYGTNQI